jgi:ribonucleoside-diphosphate reductase alpha chain
VEPDNIETASDLARDYKRRMAFQADVQDYVDQSISSTINLPPWGSELNNEDTVMPFAKALALYAPRLRGFTCYPDGSRGGQPITTVSFKEAMSQRGTEFKEVFHDACSGGVCGI